MFAKLLNSSILQGNFLWKLLCLGVLCLAYIIGMREVYAFTPVNSYVLKIEMAPAKCLLDPSLQKQRQCLEGYNLVVSGLFPDTYVANRCHTNSSPNLPPLQARATARLMPNERERQRLWANVGGCISGNASQYFRTITVFAESFTVPRVLISDRSQVMQASYLHQQIVRSNGQVFPKDAVRFGCEYSPRHKQTFLTEIKVCYTAKGAYRACGVQETSNCPSSFTIQGAY